MDFSTQLRKTYLGAPPHTLYTDANQFGLSAHLTAEVLFVFAVYHYIKVKQENHE